MQEADAGCGRRMRDAASSRGEYGDRADVVRQLGSTRTQVTQIRDLLQLDPDIQEEIAFLEVVDGVEPLSERGLQGVIRCWTAPSRSSRALEGWTPWVAPRSRMARADHRIAGTVLDIAPL